MCSSLGLGTRIALDFARRLPSEQSLETFEIELAPGEAQMTAMPADFGGLIQVNHPSGGSCYIGKHRTAFFRGRTWPSTSP